MIAVKFSCKDPLLATYYNKLFGEKFTAHAQYWPKLTEMERKGIRCAWQLEMFHEARLQEHYDYVEHDGHRTPAYEVYDRDGLRVVTEVPTLLIPEVEVIEVSSGMHDSAQDPT